MEPLKNNLSPTLIKHIASHLARHLDDFDARAFRRRLGKDWDVLELKQRSAAITEAMHDALPTDMAFRYKILQAILHPEEGATTLRLSDERGIRGWGMLPLCSLVGRYGTDHFDESMALLREMTKRFSAEFDVRFFLLRDQARALKIMSSWVEDANVHVRRLVSEGTRPRLPWAMQLPSLIADPSPVLPLLTALRDDPEEYVRRSVANHLNDISKDHPDAVANLTEVWMRDAGKNRQRLLRHACRTLIKQGHSRVLKIFGYGKPKIRLEQFRVATPKVYFGRQLEFGVRIRSESNSSQSLLVDYVIHYQKHHGGLNQKVFKWKVIELEKNAMLTLARRHSFKAVTTRKHYPGLHAVSLRINGIDMGYQEFILIDK